MTEMTPDQIYAQYFDSNGQPVRAGAVLNPDEEALYRQFFADDTTPQTITEESA